MSTEWIFDATPASGRRRGGVSLFHSLGQVTLEKFVRETTQNVMDLPRAQGLIRPELLFRLEEYSGADVDKILDAADWETLRPHLKAVADGDDHGSERISLGLERVDSRRLRVLYVEDYGTIGLVGGEDDHKANYCKLCRDELVTEHTGTRGGSYGVGKAVLWLFSQTATVIFGSTVASGDRTGPRLFGRTFLPTHTVDGEDFEGDGWVGETDPAKPRAISIWDEDAVDRMVDLGMRRDGRPGTSIAILDFDDPTKDDEPSVQEMCATLAEALRAWYWPAVHADRIHITVEGRVEGSTAFSEVIDLDEARAPWVDAQAGAAGEELEEGGDIVEVDIPVTFPRRKDDAATGKQTAMAKLRVRRAVVGEMNKLNTVALQRGSTGMVVQYWPPNVASEVQFQAVLLAGRAVGETPEDLALEAYLRAAEPTAHDSWTHTSPNLERYKTSGRNKALADLYQAMSSHVRRLTGHVAADASEGPRRLSKLFDLGSEGSNPEPAAFQLEPGAIATREGAQWKFKGSFSRVDGEDEPWEASIGVLGDQEQGARANLDITTFEAGGLATTKVKNEWVVTVPAGIKSVHFSGVADAAAIASVAVIPYMGAVLDVQGVSR